MFKKDTNSNYSLFVISVLVSIITYGFALTNFSLTIDSETPYFSDFAMGLGRWGSNLIRYKIFDGHLPYFTLLLGLVFLSLSAVELTKIFKLKGIYAISFCCLYVSFPQHSYQLAFNIQADAIPIGFYISILAVSLFINNIENYKKITSLTLLLFSCFLIVFGIAIYQALIFIPLITYLIYFFVKINSKTYILKAEFKKLFLFLGLLLVATILYYFSVKILCPADNGGYLNTYVIENGNNRFVDFYNLCVDHIYGDYYYGEKTFFLTSLSAIVLAVIIILKKKNMILNLSLIVALLLLPFCISFFITSGANPPRLYVSSPIVFAFFIIYLSNLIYKKYNINYSFLSLLIILLNIYFVTNLFYSNNKVFKHDVALAQKIDNKINNKFPDFNPNSDYVFFYGALPSTAYDKLTIPNTDIFTGSFFRWDGGNNWRILNFFRFNDIAYYKFLDNEEAYLKVKETVLIMPTWPNDNSVEKIDNIIIVKLGDVEGVLPPLN